MEVREAKPRMRLRFFSLISLACLAAPAAAHGHAEEMTFGELAATVAEAGGSPLPMLEAPDATTGDPPVAEAAAPASWYSRAPVAPRIGASTEDRYSLAGGCFGLRSPSEDAGFLARSDGEYAADAEQPDGEVFRFQPTGLGSYLLLGSAGRLPAADGDEVAPSAGPSPAAEWVVRGDGASGFEFATREGEALAAGANGALTLDDEPTRFDLVAAKGCASFPEIEVNTSGAPRTVSPRYKQTRGMIDLHSHLLAFQAFGKGLHCGRPWHPLGVESALVDCPDHAPNGLGGLASNMFVFQDPTHQHHPDGWPTFQGWPTYEWVFTHEQTYYRWIERAWRGGMRLITLLAVDNSAACLVNVHRTESCNEMDAVRRQLESARKLQNYIDAQWGGPGEGFFRIVKNPFQARRVINKGKLAIVLGIEVSEPLDCGVRNGVPQCDEDDVTTRLDEMHDAGVRQMEIVNKFDNAFGGVAMDGGFQGPVVNSGNKLTTGEYWDVETCTGPESDRTQITNVPEPAATLIELMPGGPLQPPVYPEPPHCNKKGLTELGEHLIREMAKRKMIFDPDHLSVKAREQALEVIDDLNYSGVVSSHSWGDPTSYKRIMELGGVVTPMAPHAHEADEEWEAQRQLYEEGTKTRKYGFGFGFGDDMNGFGGPRNPTAGTDAEISYPFTSPLDKGVTVEPQQSGTRTYDLNNDGVAHFGQLVDWTEGVRQDAGDEIIQDLRTGSEFYLRMWERAVGIRGPNRKRTRVRLDPKGMPRMKVGMRPKQLLREAGQPITRTRGWRWGVRGSDDVTGAAFRGKRVGLVASSARRYRAAGVKRGTPVGQLPKGARSLGSGIWVLKASDKTRYVYGVAGGEVRVVGVGSDATTATARRTTRALRLALGA